MASEIDGSKAAAAPKSDPVTATVAQNTLSELLNRVAFGGEEIVITRHDKPVAKLVPIDSAA